MADRWCYRDDRELDMRTWRFSLPAGTDKRQVTISFRCLEAEVQKPHSCEQLLAGAVGHAQPVCLSVPQPLTPPVKLAYLHVQNTHERRLISCTAYAP